MGLRSAPKLAAVIKTKKYTKLMKTSNIILKLLGFSLILVTATTFGQLPKSGVYEYEVAFAEWSGKSLGTTVMVIISGDSIKVINNGSLSGEKGEIIEEGKIIKHKSTGQWIISTKPEDEYAEEVGGCSDGPRIIDFKNKKWWTC
jgi:hypothetical protein